MKDIKALRKLIHQIHYILSKKERLQIVGMFFVIWIGSLFELMGVSIVLPFIQAILDPEELMTNSYILPICSFFQIHNASSMIMLIGCGMVILYIVKNVYLAFSAYLQAVFSNNIQKNLSVLMLSSYMNRPYSFFVNHGSDIIMRGVNVDTGGVYFVIQDGFKLLAELLTIIAISVYLILTDWMLALGVLAVGLMCLTFIFYGMKKEISRLSSISRIANAKRYKWELQVTGGIKDILVYGRQKYFAAGYEKAYKESNKASIRYTAIGALPERIIEAFCISGIIITVLLRLQMGNVADSFIPKIAVFAMGAFRLLPSISRSSGYINTFVFYREHVEATYENIIAAKELEKERKDSSIKTVPSNNLIDECTFKNVIQIQRIQWQYSENRDMVLDNFSMDIKKGEAIGIIGASGSGKSTFADIILRLYHPQKGSILMDETNIEMIPEVWSNLIGYVPQSIFLLDGTIRDNVVFGARDENDEKVWSSLKKTSLDRFISGLPDGLDTMVGERGVKFSGGQRQRIAIARALYNEPQILILDEATSALDNETEEAVMEAIDALAGAMTLIIIAHRVTTLKNCDRIYEIVDGKAIERDKKTIFAPSGA